ncbi:MAG: Integral rane protein TerC [Actinotalea sp.]|nr:Integral rane protein TerC [Actinotalea sp.]
MEVHPYAWAITVVVMVAILSFDVFVIGRRPHEPSTKEATTAIAFFVGLAVLFGLGVWFVSGGQYAGEFFAGWITEYSLSVDNLFIFLIIMTRFAVPRPYQQKVLLIGIAIALVMRGLFIWAGAAAIAQFSWVFYIFGAVLVYTAVKLAREDHDTEKASEYHENALLRWVRRAVPSTDEFHGDRMTVVQAGRRLITPMLIVMVAIGSTDLLFALDSIPAIFGLTKEPYIVFTANAFALMGLRQLYFVLGGLLQRLVYLSEGLAIVLAFIGVKLILEALHTNELPFVNGGQHVEWAPEIPIWLSLTVILGTLTVATVLSLLKTRRDSRGLVPPVDEPVDPELPAVEPPPVARHRD